MGADISWNSYKITSLADPTLAQDAATKNYVDEKVAIVKGTHYLAISSAAFGAIYPDDDDVFIDPTSTSATGNGIVFVAPVNLPHGAVVTACVVYGSAGAAAETWQLIKSTMNTATGIIMATANIDTEDTSITAATIDNSANHYGLKTSTLDTTDSIYGARITYTL